MTLKQAKAELEVLGMTIRKEAGEYRVNEKGGKEATAYYTDDLDDAVRTGREMASLRN